jgi:hypothetical protein
MLDTFQILSGKGWKTWSTAVALVHQNRVAFKVWQQFMEKPFRKGP